MIGKALEILYQAAVVKDGASTFEERVRCVVKKWQFQDSVMGEQYISFTISSEAPIEWAVGDYCVYRGEMFTLNYVPSVTQRARRGEVGDAFTYEMVKMDSCRVELDRAIMLDITPTTGDYIAALGTNFTGSDQFQLFCGETSVLIDGNPVTLTPVCALAAKIQANLDRAFPTSGWKVLVDVTSTHDVNGVAVFNTHTDDKMLQFDNTTIASALSEVHNTFDLDFSVKGRTIKIGFAFDTLTEGDDGTFYYLGYGKGKASIDNQGVGLFQIKKESNSNQKIVTRLRVLGSKKNLPYRYYNKKYDLSQSMFPLNLQLPGTFESPAKKKANHLSRKAIYPFVREVLGDTNDSYIDKDDDALSTIDGLREGSVKFDGSDSNLEEIYPTIREATYGELRGAGCKDQDGVSDSTRSFPNYLDSERIDAVLKVGNNANIGSGIAPDSNAGSETQQVFECQKTFYLCKSQVNYDGSYYIGNEITMFSVDGQAAGDYLITPSQFHVWYGVKYSIGRHAGSGIVKSAKVGYRIIIYAKPKSTGTRTKIGTFVSELRTISSSASVAEEFELPQIPAETTSQISKIELTENSDVDVVLQPIFRDLDYELDTRDFNMFIGRSKLNNDLPTDFKPEWVWSRADTASTYMETPFTIIVKDMGFDFAAAISSGEEPTVSMTSGRCVGRGFVINENPTKVTVYKNGKTYKGWQLTLSRAQDDNLNTYYPSENDPIAEGDHFVLLNIEMPDVYIQMAEVRLLIAATNYLKDNCETQFSYVPTINDIFLQQDFDEKDAAGMPEKSLYWKLYAGLMFPFKGIPQTSVPDEDEVLPILDITIEQLTIKEGEGLTPKVDIKLNSDVQQTTMQRITTAVDRIYNGSIFSNGAGSSLSAIYSAIKDYVTPRFLSRKFNDKASGRIEFLQGLQSVLDAEFGTYHRERALVGDESDTGSIITSDGTADFINLIVRGLVKGELNVEDLLRVKDMIFTNTVKSDGARQGFLDGLGIFMNAKEGLIEADGMNIRGFMRVMELIINRLQLMESDYSFTEGDTTERVDFSDEGQRMVLTMHKEHDNDHTPFYPGDILYAKINDLLDHGTYYTSYVRVISVDLSNNTMKVAPWVGKNALGENEVPGGTNFTFLGTAISGDDFTEALTADYAANPNGYEKIINLTRHGNVADGLENGDDPNSYSTSVLASQKARQNAWVLSTTDKRLSFFWNVDKPIIEDSNYALCLGILPDLANLPSTRDKSMPSLYVNTIFYDHHHDANYPARVVKEDRGQWSDNPTVDYNGQTISEPYHYKTYTRQIWLQYRNDESWNELTDSELHQKMMNEWKVDLEASRVWNNGILWECLVDGTTQEPKWGCTHWKSVGGNTIYKGEITTSNGRTFRNGNVDTVLTMRLWYGDEEITSQILNAVDFSIAWKRSTGYNAETDEFVQQSEDLSWTPNVVGANQIKIERNDMGSGWMITYRQALVSCTVTFSADGQVVNMPADYVF